VARRECRRVANKQAGEYVNEERRIVWRRGRLSEVAGAEEAARFRRPNYTLRPTSGGGGGGEEGACGYGMAVAAPRVAVGTDPPSPFMSRG